jgi:hypothetical protein
MEKIVIIYKMVDKIGSSKLRTYAVSPREIAET